MWFESILFLVLWFGCASFHTLFDLKVKPFLKEKIAEYEEPSMRF